MDRDNLWNGPELTGTPSTIGLFSAAFDLMTTFRVFVGRMVDVIRTMPVSHQTRPRRRRQRSIAGWCSGSQVAPAQS